MIANNDNEDPDLDVTDLPTDQYPVLSESDVTIVQEAVVLNGAGHASGRSKDEPVRAASSLTHLESEVNRLQGKWQSVETEFKQRETRITLLHEELRTREATIAKLSADLQAADEHLESKDAALALLDAERRARDERIGRLSKELADAEVTHKDTLEKLARADSEVARVNDLVRREQEATARVAERNEQILAEQEPLRCKLQDLEIYINGRHDRWFALNAELAGLKSALRDAERTVKARDAVIAHHDEEKRELATSIHDLEHRCSELAGRRKEREETYDELQKKLAAHLAQTEQLKIEYATRTKETELAGTNALNTQHRIESLEGGIERREAEIAALKAEVEQAKLATGELTTARTALGKRVDDLETQLASTQEGLDQQSRHAERLAKERDAAQQESARIRADLEKLSAHASELGRLRSEAVAETEQLKLALAAQQDLVAKLEAELRAKRATADMLERSVDRITGLGASLAALDQHMNGNGKHHVQHVPLDDEPNGNVVDIGEQTEIEAIRKLVVTIDGQSFDYPILKKHMTIGRSQDNDIRIASHFVSRVHATVSTNGAATIIEDAGSKNGVLVNSERVQRRVLHNGDVVTVGDDSSLRFVDATH